MSRAYDFYRTPSQEEIEEQERLEYLEWYNEQKESNNKKQNKMKAEEKDKAKELVDKYWKIDTNNDYWMVDLQLGKKMANIAVDEILQLNVDVEYWKAVKLEITKYLR